MGFLTAGISVPDEVNECHVGRSGLMRAGTRVCMLCTAKDRHSSCCSMLSEGPLLRHVKPQQTKERIRGGLVQATARQVGDENAGRGSGRGELSRGVQG